MRLPQPRDDRGRLDVQMTPMIDVVFLLMIFFVCTANFQALEQSLPTNLFAPGKGAASAPLDPELQELDDIRIRISLEGKSVRWRVRDRVFDRLADVRDLLTQLATLRTDLPVILDVSGDVPLGPVIDVYDVCRLCGFRNVQFAASEKV